MMQQSTQLTGISVQLNFLMSLNAEWMLTGQAVWK